MGQGKKSKLFLFIQLCILSTLATAPLLAHAEYYLVYSAPEFSDGECAFCTTHHSHRHHRVHHRTVSATTPCHQAPHHVRHARRYGPRSGLYVYYPYGRGPCPDIWTSGYCPGCANHNRVQSQYGDYVVFSSRPVNSGYGKYGDVKPTYDPDASTSDDGRPDLEIN